LKKVGALINNEKGMAPIEETLGIMNAYLYEF